MLETNETEEVKVTVQERILKAAEEAFATSSFAGTRISEIAVKAEVNQALIHYYFDSKERLYQEVLTALFQQWEAYVQKWSWDGLDPESIIREYIRIHYELKCDIPNLYKIFHWEALEGGELFNKYASSTWTQDFLEKAQLFNKWKEAGIINSKLNVNVLLFSLWGMMNQFYYREQDDLQSITGLKGSTEELHSVVVEQMIQFAMHGILAGDKLEIGGCRQEETEAGRMEVTVLMPGGQGYRDHEDTAKLLGCLESLTGVTVNVIEEEEQLKVLPGTSRLFFVFASTKYGEMPPWIVRLLQTLEQDGSSAADRLVAVWTIRDNPAAEGVQRMLEDAFNRLGAFSAARIPGQSPRDYIKRCAKLMGM
ncbi:hypothetical protein Back11_38050 [Paenibacillus baekrokdamisoli]|uniref:Uncharacterized protein n=1 Tax=Paenibacillus baekrokdamisoli TaxID=1712516 RepID=A0A3G9IUA3_9BACL|nr:TetR family transcriptional regulator C-terminal domain-containing protein [Paenibacillus baekrokdamisoli]MBB3068500.1 AcrR family transcriptional regulator [Paenibacillus baekrokdamisoli]BBH22460.1 hypothetical protein Back11_38050 [Paenibacillus baekrokdamisoli]